MSDPDFAEEKPSITEEAKQAEISQSPSPAPPISAPPAPDAADKDSVGRIRDILFGAHVKQYDQKFNSVDETLKKETARLRDEAQKSTEALEIFTRKGLESITCQLKNEQTERSDAFSQLSGKLDEFSRNLDKKISRLDETTQSGRQDLQEQVLKQSKDLRQEIQTMHEDLAAALQRAVEELRKDKADRLALGNLFTEIGLRLKEEFKMPEVK